MRSAKKKLFEAVIEVFSRTMPQANSELNFSNTYQLLVAVMLSAQCTDKRVNLTTPALFGRFPDINSLSKAEPQEVLSIIKSISYPNSKAAHLVGAARKIAEDFNGEIPTDIDKLMTLPGVGRKTANVVASITWGEPVIAVKRDSLRSCARKHTTGSSCTADTPARHKSRSARVVPSHSCVNTTKPLLAELLLESFYLVIGISTLGPEIELDFRFRA